MGKQRPKYWKPVIVATQDIDHGTLAKFEILFPLALNHA